MGIRNKSTRFINQLFTCLFSNLFSRGLPKMTKITMRLSIIFSITSQLLHCHPITVEHVQESLLQTDLLHYQFTVKPKFLQESTFCDDRPNGYYRDPEDCSAFYQCWSGLTYYTECPSGLFFNEELIICDWPDNVDCNMITTTHTPTTDVSVLPDETTHQVTTSPTTQAPINPTTTSKVTTTEPMTESTVEPTTKPTTVSTTSPSNNLKCPSPFTRNVIYLDYKINWSDIASDIKAAVENCFNVINLGFWMSGQGYVDAAVTFANTPAQTRQEILDYVHSHNAKLMLSIGGATEHLESMIANNQGRSYGLSAAQAAADLNFDGVDFDLELQPGNNQPFLDGSFQTFLIDCTNAARSILGDSSLISHAPQAPYLGQWAGPTLGYVAVLEHTSIDFLNIQFYNQGPGEYTTYENLMINEGEDSWLAGSAVKEMIDSGVPVGKIVIGKPIGPTGYANNGYVPPIQLKEFACRFKTEFGLEVNGFMTWMYPGSNDPLLGEFGSGVSQSC